MSASVKDENSQSEVDSKNSAFWNELCGSHLASVIGVTDDSPQSLAYFDKWFFDFYPYLDQYIEPEDIKGKRVLEVGLGYGSVGQYMASKGAIYTGLDIAAGPVNMMKHRLSLAGLKGDAVQGSILDAPFEDASFDIIVAIGCLHHTGNMKLATQQCRRLLKPGGRLMMMVYYAYSYRQFVLEKEKTFEYMRKELMGYRGVINPLGVKARASADTNAEGEAAPHTDWVGKWSMKSMLKKAGFARVEATTQNIDQATPYAKSTREELLKTIWPKIWGLDLYIKAYV